MAKKSDTSEPKQTAIAYTIKLKGGGDFSVRESANGWWLDQHKVSSLLTGLEYNCTIEEACDLADITPKQYKYFADLHPEIQGLRKSSRASSILKARAAIRKSLDEPKWAHKYLKNKVPGEYGEDNVEARVQEAIMQGWAQLKIQIQAIVKVRRDAQRGGINIPGFTDNEDPMPWNPKDHRKEFQKVLDAFSAELRRMVTEAKAARDPNNMNPIEELVAASRAQT